MQNTVLEEVFKLKDARQLLQKLTAAFITVCDKTLNLSLRPQGEPTIFNPALVIYGSCINIITDQGTLRLAIGLDEQSCHSLSAALNMRDLYANPNDEEIADALGEILNMTAGVVVRELSDAAVKKVDIGLPEFLSLNDFFELIGEGYYLRTQKVEGMGLTIQVILLMYLEVAGRSR